jgi:hypothetical protein
MRQRQETDCRASRHATARTCWSRRWRAYWREERSTCGMFWRFPYEAVCFKADNWICITPGGRERHSSLGCSHPLVLRLDSCRSLAKSSVQHRRHGAHLKDCITHTADQACCYRVDAVWNKFFTTLFPTQYHALSIPQNAFDIKLSILIIYL